MRTKLFRRAFSFLLIAFMAFTVLPMGLIDFSKPVHADAQHTQVGMREPAKENIIDTITITNADLTPFIGIETGDCLDSAIPSDANYIINYSYWYDNTSGTGLYHDDVFVEGHEYSITWRLEAAAGYTFSEDATVTINGGTSYVNAELTVIDADNATRFHVWTVPMEAVPAPVENIIIDTITITNADVTPMVGATPDMCFEYELPDDANYIVTAHYWHCDSDNETMDEYSIFDEGKMYSLCWEFEAADGYEFSEDTTVTINGGTSLIDVGFTSVGTDPTLFEVWTRPKEAGPDTENIIIDTITITNADITPVVGITAGECLDYELPEDANYTVIEHHWYCDTDDDNMLPSNVFEEGKLYSLTWTVVAAEGFEFFEDAVVTINGSSDIVDMEFTAISTDHEAFYVWVLPSEAEPAPVENIIIDTITITNAVITPVVGITAGECLGYEVPEDANYTVTEHHWMCDTDDDNMLPSNVFEEGKLYSLTLTIVAADGYEFSEDTVVTINGSTSALDMEWTNINDEDATMFWVWTLPTEAEPAPVENIIIDTITITNAVITPVVGITAGECLGYELPDDANYTVTEHHWMCDTDDYNMLPSDVFEEGKEYSVYWEFLSAEGYEFAEDTVVLINGSSDMLDMDNTEIDSTDPTVFWVWTLPTEAEPAPVENIIIDTITITNADITPVVGITAGECLGYELPDDANYTVSEHYWFCDTDASDMLDADVFEEGKEYSVYWEFLAAEGYEFAEDTVVTINGSSDMLDMDNTEIDSTDPTVFWVWTLPTEALQEEPEFEVGDVNMDGNINTGDAVILLRQSVGLVEFTAQQEILADFNGDGKINTGDAVSVLKYCVGL